MSKGQQNYHERLAKQAKTEVVPLIDCHNWYKPLQAMSVSLRMDRAKYDLSIDFIQRPMVQQDFDVDCDCHWQLTDETWVACTHIFVACFINPHFDCF